MRCGRCLGGHDTASHEKMEQTFERYENWGIGSAILPDLGLDGERGALSRSVTNLAPPDRLRIVRCTIGTDGWDAANLPGSGILRLWRKDPAGGCTFMLSCDRLMDGEIDSLVRLFGDRGSTVMVALNFSRSTGILAPSTI